MLTLKVMDRRVFFASGSLLFLMDNISSVISIGSLNSKGVFEPEFEDEDVVEDGGPEGGPEGGAESGAEGGAEDKEEEEEDKKEE